MAASPPFPGGRQGQAACRGGRARTLRTERVAYDGLGAPARAGAWASVVTAGRDRACVRHGPACRMHGRRSVVDILLIADETGLRRTLRTALESMGHVAAEAPDGGQALARLRGRAFALAFVALRLGRESGLDLLPELLRAAPGLAVVLVTAYASVETAVEAMRRGAFDYLPKPFTPGQVRVVLDRWSALRRLRDRVADLEREAPGRQPDEDFRTEAAAMRRVLHAALRAAASNATLLLRGESGTGKGVLARALHARSPRATGPFVTVHCPSLSAQLLESDRSGPARRPF